ncbi:MAG: STE24 endopeptidase, partial [Planctomycetota bacterium]
GFPLTEVSVVDASNRSSHANAFFTGFGKRKRIALFDTLLERHSHDEVTAILAHEIGHWSLGHIWRGSVLSIIQMGGFLALLGWVLSNSAVFAAFGVAQPSVHVGLALFGILTAPLGLLLGPAFTALSRRNEFQADAYAREITGRPEDLVRGLTRLSSESLSNLTPHPLYVALNYSHPPLLQRVRALQQG